MEIKPKTPEWEKDFDENYPIWNRQAMSHEDTAKEIKSFITHVRNDALGEAAEAIKSLGYQEDESTLNFRSDVFAAIRFLKK